MSDKFNIFLFLKQCFTAYLLSLSIFTYFKRLTSFQRCFFKTYRCCFMKFNSFFELHNAFKKNYKYNYAFLIV